MYFVFYWAFLEGKIETARVVVVNWIIVKKSQNLTVINEIYLQYYRNMLYLFIHTLREREKILNVFVKYVVDFIVVDLF